MHAPTHAHTLSHTHAHTNDTNIIQNTEEEGDCTHAKLMQSGRSDAQTNGGRGWYQWLQGLPRSPRSVSMGSGTAVKATKGSAHLSTKQAPTHSRTPPCINTLITHKLKDTPDTPSMYTPSMHKYIYINNTYLTYINAHANIYRCKMHTKINNHK